MYYWLLLLQLRDLRGISLKDRATTEKGVISLGQHNLKCRCSDSCYCTRYLKTWCLIVHHCFVCCCPGSVSSWITVFCVADKLRWRYPAEESAPQNFEWLTGHFRAFCGPALSQFVLLHCKTLFESRSSEETPIGVVVCAPCIVVQMGRVCYFHM